MKKKHKGDGRSVSQRINEFLDLPPDVLPGETMVEIRAAGSAFIRGTKKILLYSPTRIRLATKRGALEVVGSSLLCTSYHPDGVRIDGRIISVLFEEAKNDAD